MINAYLQDDVTLNQAAAYDTHGEPGVETNIALKGKVEFGERLVKDIKGELVACVGRVILQTRTITLEDHITYGGVKYIIINIAKPKDWSWGYLEVFIQ